MKQKYEGLKLGFFQNLKTPCNRALNSRFSSVPSLNLLADRNNGSVVNRLGVGPTAQLTPKK